MLKTVQFGIFEFTEHFIQSWFCKRVPAPLKSENRPFNVDSEEIFTAAPENKTIVNKKLLSVLQNKQFTLQTVCFSLREGDSVCWRAFLCPVRAIKRTGGSIDRVYSVNRMCIGNSASVK